MEIHTHAEVVADLRNKLGPLFSYPELSREITSLRKEIFELENRNLNVSMEKQFTLASLEKLGEESLITCLEYMGKVKLILTELEGFNEAPIPNESRYESTIQQLICDSNWKDDEIVRLKSYLMHAKDHSNI